MGESSINSLLDGTYLPVIACYARMQMVSVNSSFCWLPSRSVVPVVGSAGMLEVEEASFLAFHVLLFPGSADCVSSPVSSSCSVCILQSDSCRYDSWQHPVAGSFECLPRLLPVNSIPWLTLGGLSWKSLENSRKLLVHHLSNFTTIQYVLPWHLQWGLGWSLQVREVLWSTVSVVGIDCICVLCIF